MNRLRPALFLTASILVASSTALADDCCEKIEAGFVFVKPASGAAVIREVPDHNAKVVGKPPVGARLVYRKAMEDLQRNYTWYRVEPPGGTPGWIAAADTTRTRPIPPPPGRPLKVVDSGLGAPRPTAAQTAAARGLSDKAQRYANEKPQELKLSVDQFLTMEKAVETLYDDPHNAADGSYPDSDPKGMRKQRAAKFRAEINK